VAGADTANLEPPRFKIALLMLLDRLLGPTFTVRRLEAAEESSIQSYKDILSSDGISDDVRARLQEILHQEEEHEATLKSQLADDRLTYLGSAVLGLNDALIELTGGLTGLVSSIRDPRLIGFSGLIVGIAASLSMAASNFLSTNMSTEQKAKPGIAAAYTGTTYIVTTLALVAPFFFLSDRHIALASTWLIAVAITAGFAYYSAALLELPFTRHFVRMLALAIGIAIATFFIGKGLSSLLHLKAYA
jgi:VIT1/CCC1 family predicted Fe2+/Mn2+ transporter